MGLQPPVPESSLESLGKMEVYGNGDGDADDEIEEYCEGDGDDGDGDDYEGQET